MPIVLLLHILQSEQKALHRAHDKNDAAIFYAMPALTKIAPAF
ncbi:hypothetical protein CKO_03464 [Citrobacter koseri ATCC BAA-895]|uniref:Uncharacterized protein n=1 Tax=Citrobacter koseri (strain ATCC BAA-895 / CDC 4225-83 / SGSC4696) TaxID=290338 RepID=A8AM31_CITK8|nr:hypothetical protein CKO_03464 [Citrobacter koseri ATCC BAA-895]